MTTHEESLSMTIGQLNELSRSFRREGSRRIVIEDRIIFAKRHKNLDGTLGGFVADTAEVEETVHVGSNARIYDFAKVSGNVYMQGDAEIFGHAVVSGDVHLKNRAKVFGKAQISGHAKIYGLTRIYGNARVSDHAIISGNAEVFGSARVDDKGWRWGRETVPTMKSQHALLKSIYNRFKQTKTAELPCGLSGWIQFLSSKKAGEVTYQDAVKAVPCIAHLIFDSPQKVEQILCVVTKLSASEAEKFLKSSIAKSL